MLAAAILGNHLPPPFAQYVSPGTGIERIEKVRRLVHGDAATQCAYIFGDSRAAFSINAAELTDCPALNFGFPALGTREVAVQIDEIDTDRKAEVALLSLTMESFLGSSIIAQGFGQKGEYALTDRERLLVHPVSRTVLFGFDRIRLFVRTTLGFEKMAYDGWSYAPQLGRWVYYGLHNRVLIDVPPEQQQVAETARSTFANKWGIAKDTRQVVEILVHKARRIAHQVVLILPPQFPAFTEAEAHYLPTTRGEFVRAVSDAAAATRSIVIDCTDHVRCGLTDRHFADPVHLNDAGAAAYTAAIRHALEALAKEPDQVAKPI